MKKTAILIAMVILVSMLAGCAQKTAEERINDILANVDEKNAERISDNIASSRAEYNGDTYCGNCDKYIEGHARICPYCGQYING